MSDNEYLLNGNLNPFQELEFIQILSELSDLHDTLKKNQNLYTIPIISRTGSIYLISTPKT